MVWVYLGGAILSEVIATISLRLSEGMSKWTPGVVVVIGYLLSFVLLAQVLKLGLSVGVAYGIWSAVGVSLVALIGAAFLGESLSWVQVGGLLLVIAGVVALQSGAAPE
ncbi:MAG TPA: multidrug efflux SMR transporter [Pseudonocardia sp.]|jgi:small multidrug resistance pump|nr:multidrug efflux SMR transporter [Pseudonocardia sp.]